MAKRKRSEDEEATQTDSVKRRRVQHKLEASTTKLGHAFKVSKGLERQKLGRRRKNAVAQRDEKTVTRLDLEIEALKTLDTTTAAHQHLYKALLKIKGIAEHADLPEEVTKLEKITLDTATLNVNARLCKSNQVQEALNAALDEIRNAFGLASEKPVSSKKQRLRAKDVTASAADKTSPDPRERKKNGRMQRPTQEARESDASNDDNEDNYGSFEDRLAHSSEEDEEAGSDVDDIERRLALEGVERNGAKKRPRSNGYDHERDLSISDAESDQESTSPEPQKAPAAKKSSFLPSLTMGGYISGSGSDIEDEIDKPVKKNRRGQRARQQIWEQKYGETAKHLQKQDRNSGWDPRRGASGGGKRHGQSHNQRNVRRSSPGYNLGSRETNQDNTLPRAADDKKKQKHRDDDGSIHPSWEAAKKAKEKKDAPVAFQGRKTTFD